MLRSHLTARYGRDAIPADMTIQDWGITYDELEPHFDRFEKLCGTSGKAGNLRGSKIEGGNIFEGPRSSEYPNKPLIMSQAGLIFSKAAKSLGYHPFPTPASNSSAAYTNPEGLTIGQCQYCGHCEYFGCETNAKASPLICLLPALTPDRKFELRIPCLCSRLIYDKQAKKVRGVVYIDRRTGEEIEQPADLVVLCAYPFNNTLLLLTAGIGEPYDPATGNGVVGKNYCQQTNSGVQLFVDDEINPFIGTGATPAAIDDFQGDNFDHVGLGLLRRRLIAPLVSGGRPIQVRAGAAGHAALGLGMEGSDGALVQPRLPAQLPRDQLCASHELSRSRSHLQGRDRTPAGAHDLQLPRQRLQDVGVPHAESGGDRAVPPTPRSSATPQPRRGNYRRQQRPAPRTIPAAPSWAPIRRPARINRYLQSLGREQPVRDGRGGVPAECRP